MLQQSVIEILLVVGPVNLISQSHARTVYYNLLWANEAINQYRLLLAMPQRS